MSYIKFSISNGNDRKGDGPYTKKWKLIKPKNLNN